jgi:hypothetical protein
MGEKSFRNTEDDKTRQLVLFFSYFCSKNIKFNLFLGNTERNLIMQVFDKDNLNWLSKDVSGSNGLKVIPYYDA